MNAKNILVMGLGRGMCFARAAEASSVVRLTGVVEPDEARLRRADNELGLGDSRLFSSFDEALRDGSADIIVVATPTHLHCEHVTGALEAGLHVLCEKPLAARRDEAVRMRRESIRYGRQLAVVQNARYGSHFVKCRQLLADGVIGDLVSVHFRFRRWRAVDSIKHPHALLFNHGCHHVDTIRFVTGAVAEKVLAVEWDPPGAGQGGHGAMLRMTVFARGGVVVCYDGSYSEAGTQTPHPGHLLLSGSAGTLEAFGEFEDPQLWLSRNARACDREVRRRIEVEPSGWDQIDCRIIEDFARAVESGDKVQTDIEDNLQTVEWLFMAAEYLDRNERSTS